MGQILCMKLSTMYSTVISLIVPIYNEAPHLGAFLRIIDELSFDPLADASLLQKELIFIDDCSRD